MVYIEPLQIKKINSFAKLKGINVSQMAREAFAMRMANESDLFNSGFDEGLREAIKIANNCDGASMMFPSGKSFAKIVGDDIEKHLRLVNEKANDDRSG